MLRLPVKKDDDFAYEYYDDTDSTDGDSHDDDDDDDNDDTDIPMVPEQSVADLENALEDDGLGLLGPGAGVGPLEFAACEVRGSGCCCCCGFETVGGMHVVCERRPRPRQKRQLLCVLGPYWYLVLFVTTPLIVVPCGLAVVYMAPLVHPALTLAFALAALFVLAALWKTATTDPGLVVRRGENPEATCAG
jgi:hypothetical protein